MPKVSQEHSAAQRKVILDAAIRCFAKRGFHRATMRDVLCEAGMSAGAVYLYFKSKEELIEAIATSRHLRERQWVASALKPGDVAKRLQGLVRSFARILMDREEEHERRLGIQLWSESLLDRKVHASVLAGVEMPTRLLTQFFKAAQKRGDFPKSLDCRSAARVLVALYQGLVLQATWEPGISFTPHLKVIKAMLLALTVDAGEKTR